MGETERDNRLPHAPRRRPSHRLVARPDLVAGFWRDNRGATAIEYGLIGMLIASVVVAAVSSLGGGVSALFSTFATAIQNAM